MTTAVPIRGKSQLKAFYIRESNQIKLIYFVQNSRSNPYIAPIVIPASGTITVLATIHAPMNYTAPCIMFWMHAYTLRGEVGGGWALEFPSFLGPVKWERADRRVPCGDYLCTYDLYSPVHNVLDACIYIT